MKKGGVKKALPVFAGEVTADAQLVLMREEAYARKAHLQSLAPRQGTTRVDVTITRHRDTRSERANAYYWSCVLGPMAEHTGDSDEDIHDAMCELFLPKERKRIEFFNAWSGEELLIETDGRRSSKLSGAPFYDFVERVRQWALEFLGVETEDPDPEYWRHRKGRAA